MKISDFNLNKEEKLPKEGSKSLTEEEKIWNLGVKINLMLDKTKTIEDELLLKLFNDAYVRVSDVESNLDLFRLYMSSIETVYGSITGSFKEPIFDDNNRILYTSPSLIRKSFVDKDSIKKVPINRFKLLKKLKSNK